MIQNAIQSLYWASKQSAIFIVYALEQNCSHSLVISLDYLVLLTFIFTILQHLKTEVRNFFKIEIYYGGRQQYLW